MAAARVAFVRDGYGQANLDAIADDAGFSKGAVYSNFASKEALFLDVLEDKLNADARALAELARVHPVEEELIAAIEAYLRAHEEILDFTGVAAEFISQTGLNPETAKRAAGLFRHQRRVIADLMLRLSGHGSASNALACEDHAAGLIALTLGLATQRRIERASISVEQWARLIRDYLARLQPDDSSARRQRSVRSTTS
jgi:AcrR family transcriptional regulator